MAIVLGVILDLSVGISASIATAAFAVTSIAGFKYSLWLVVAAVIAHGVFDVLQGLGINNTRR